MKAVKIDKKNWTAGLEKSREKYRLIGPVKVPNKDYGEFRELTGGEGPDMTLTDTRLSPKALSFPESEVLFEYTTDEKSEDCNIMKRPDRDYSPRAVVGIRPYDAAAFLLVQKNFENADYRDPYWCDAYNACTFVGLAVNEPRGTDFSTSTKSGPFDESGLDVLLVDDGGHYIAKVISKKGENWIKAAGWKLEADSEALSERIDQLKEKAESGITSKINFDKIKTQSIMYLYDADFWEDLAFACINCGTCTYVCPTCWCFDIQDEVRGKSGKRCKNWDSCMYPLFTQHGSGHNPRPEKYMRVRQRFMHKLKYFMDKYDDGIMCVGCGRCIRSCPVNIDIRVACEKMSDYEPEKAEAS